VRRPVLSIGAFNGFILLLSPPIGNLKPAASFTFDDALAVPVAQLDLANMVAGDVNLLRDGGCALCAAAYLATRNVPYPVDPDRDRRGIEVRLRHDSECIRSTVPDAKGRLS